jgi:hypothetical protein
MARSLHQLMIIIRRRDSGIPLMGLGNRHSKHVHITSVLFSEDGRYLKTDRGLLSLNSGSPDTCLYQEQSMHAVFVNDEWVTRDGQNRL